MCLRLHYIVCYNKNNVFYVRYSFLILYYFFFQFNIVIDVPYSVGTRLNMNSLMSLYKIA